MDSKQRQDRDDIVNIPDNRNNNKHVKKDNSSNTTKSSISKLKKYKQKLNIIMEAFNVNIGKEQKNNYIRPHELGEINKKTRHMKSFRGTIGYIIRNPMTIDEQTIL